jgi:hypothetical protein
MGLKKNRQMVLDLEQVSIDWVQFRQYFYPEQIDSQMESDFPNIKNRLSLGQRTLLSAIEGNIEIAQSMTDILGRFTNPTESSRMGQTAVKRIEDEWNSVYILIQETIGIWEYRNEESARKMNPVNLISDILFPPKKKVKEERNIYQVRKVKKSFWNPTLKLILTGIVLAVLIGILYSMGILDEIIAAIGL